MPTLSAIIPTYNRAHLIVDALNSVLAQTRIPEEIVVVDDGSTDETEQVVEVWAAEHADTVRVVYRRQDNSGGNVARNLGVSLAAGDLIAFLDSDDLWLPTKTEKQIALFDDPNVGAAYCGLRETVIGSDAAPEIPTRSYPSGDLLAQLLVSDVTAPTSTYMIRRSLFDVAGVFDETLKARQDWDMWIRIAQHTQIAAVPEPLVDLRSHDGPRTVSDPTRELTAYRAILAKYEGLRAKLPLAQRQAAMASYYRRAGRVHYHHMGKPVAAIGYHLRAIITWPFAPDSYAALIGVFLTASLRKRLHQGWNRVFGRTFLSIKNH